MDAATFSSTSAFWPYKDFAFEGLEDTALKDVSYSAANDKFAVLAGSNIYLFDGNMKSVGMATFSVQEGKVKRMTATDKYIYVITSGDGIFNANIYVVDWDGNYIGRTVVDNSSQLTDINTAKSSIQGIAAYGDSLYFTIATWSQSFTDSFKVIKATMPTLPDSITPDLTIEEYFAACADNGVAAPSLVAKPLVGQYGSIASSGMGYNMGIAFDGEYVYYGTNNNGNKQITVHKATIDGTIIASSATFDVSSTDGDNARLFIKGDTLYAIGPRWEKTVGEGEEAETVVQGPVYSIKLADFKQGCQFVENNSLPLASAGVPFSVTWNEENQKYAVINTNRNLAILDANGQQLVSVTPSVAGMKTSSVTSDENYIYVSFCNNGQKSIPIQVYDWNGNLVYQMDVKGVDGADIGLGEGVGSSYNAQCICLVDGKIYISLSIWSGSVHMPVWTITPDLSVFA